MRRIAFPVAPLALALAAIPSLARADEMPPTPKPAPEHALLAKDVGVWDATVEMMFGPPGTPPSVSKGVETNRMVGGFWLVSEFESEMGGEPFRGVGTSGWDPVKGRYVGTWIDSMTPTLSTVEGRYDPKTRTLTGVMEMVENGKKVRVRETTEWKEDGTRVFSMYSAPEKGKKERLVMRITYVKR